MATVVLFHGTHSLCRQQIERQGLKAGRRSAKVYLTPSRQLAERFACSWTFGLYATGRIAAPIGVLVTAEVQSSNIDYSPTSVGEGADVCVPGGIGAVHICSIENLDFQDLWNDPVFRWRRLNECMGLLDWDFDPLSAQGALADLIGEVSLHVNAAQLQAETRMGRRIVPNDVFEF